MTGQVQSMFSSNVSEDCKDTKDVFGYSIPYLINQDPNWVLELILQLFAFWVVVGLSVGWGVGGSVGGSVGRYCN